MSLILEHVTYTYDAGTPEAFEALHDVSFEVSPHSYTALVGQTGSGKSTLVQLMNGLLKPSAGRVLIDGADLSQRSNDARSKRASVGLAFQYPEYQLFEETVEKDIAFGPKNQGLDQAAQTARVKEAMRLVGLEYETWKDRSPFELSGGQKRRVAIASVLAMKPRYLILDEPTAGLDPLGRDSILEAVHKLYLQSDMSIILVSHSMDDVARYASHMIVMNEGRKVLEGAPMDVFHREKEMDTWHLGVPTVMRLMHALQKKGMKVSDNVLTPQDAFKEIEKALQREGGVNA